MNDEKSLDIVVFTQYYSNYAKTSDLVIFKNFSTL